MSVDTIILYLFISKLKLDVKNLHEFNTAMCTSILEKNYVTKLTNVDHF